MFSRNFRDEYHSRLTLAETQTYMCATLKAAGEKFSGELSAREQVAVELGRETGLQKGRAKKVPHVSRPKRVWLAVKLGRGTESRNATAEPASAGS